MFLLHLVSKKYIFTLITRVRHYTAWKMNLKAGLTEKQDCWEAYKYKIHLAYIYLFVEFSKLSIYDQIYFDEKYPTECNDLNTIQISDLFFSDHEDQRSSWIVEGSELGSSPGEGKDGIPLPPTKPRIWSMAELAVSKSSYVGCG